MSKTPKLTKQQASLKGNSYWRLAGRQVRFDRAFNTPEELIEKACEWFKWLEDNPIEEEKLFAFQGEITRTTVQHPRPPTLASLIPFLGISRSTWGRWRKEQDNVVLKPAVDWVEEMIYAIKFEGASAGVMNPSVIIRDLGLAETTNVKADTTVRIGDDDAGL
jgi:hypothetical protein